MMRSTLLMIDFPLINLMVRGTRGVNHLINMYIFKFFARHVIILKRKKYMLHERVFKQENSGTLYRQRRPFSLSLSLSISIQVVNRAQIFIAISILLHAPCTRAFPLLSPFDGKRKKAIADRDDARGDGIDRFRGNA